MIQSSLGQPPATGSWSRSSRASLLGLRSWGSRPLALMSLEALPPLAEPPPSQLRGLAAVAAAEPPPRPSPQRAAVHERHTACSRQHALVDPDSESAAEIKALLRRDPPPPAAAARLPQLGAGADHVRHHVENLRDLVAKKRQVGGGGGAGSLEFGRLRGVAVQLLT